MQLSIEEKTPDQLKADTLVVGINQSKTLSSSIRQLDKHLKDLIKAVVQSKNFTMDAGETYLVSNPAGIHAERLLLLGLGDTGKTQPQDTQNCLKKTLTALKSTPAKHLEILIDDWHIKPAELAAWLQAAAKDLNAETYEFNFYKGKGAAKPWSIKKITFATLAKQAKANSSKGATHKTQLASHKRHLAFGKAMAEGMALCKDLGNTPPNVCNPTYLAKQAQQFTKKFPNTSVKIIDEKQLEKMGAGCFTSVSKGSDTPGKLILLEYKGAAKSQKPYVLVGKGITFDTGGISLKPGAGMDEMKYDMCGAASVMGTFLSVASLKLKINLVVAVAAAENMPSGGASRPGDIVTSLSGQTVEILNTDAEGRLVLCDTLTYIKKYKPQAVIDVATLTGACIVALGSNTALLSNHQPLADALLQASMLTNDRAWQLPLWDEYQKMLESPFADMANISSGRGAGTITAACFLSKFAEDYRWAHLDIAGSAWRSGKDKGATGRPVPLLTQYLIDAAGK